MIEEVEYLHIECPRCKNPWIHRGAGQFQNNDYIGYFYCIPCDIAYYGKANKALELKWDLSKYFDKNICLRPHVSWYWTSLREGDNPYCSFTFETITKFHITTLPWLPLNIPINKLKIYLTFI